MVYYYNMDHLKLQILQDSVFIWLVSFGYIKHQWCSVSEIPTNIITTDIYLDWRSIFCMAKNGFKQYFEDVRNGHPLSPFH